MQHHARLFSHRTSGHTVLTIRGELDIAATAALRDQIAIALKNTTTPVIIELSGVSFCDASGLALLVGARRRAKPHRLTLAAPRRNVHKLLRITGLDRAFTVHPTLTAARLSHRDIDHPAVA